jgi:hypothetical protein
MNFLLRFMKVRYYLFFQSLASCNKPHSMLCLWCVLSAQYHLPAVPEPRIEELITCVCDFTHYEGYNALLCAGGSGSICKCALIAGFGVVLLCCVFYLARPLCHSTACPSSI